MNRRDAREAAFKLTYEMIVTGEYNEETAEELLSSADGDSRRFVAGIVKGVSEHRDEIKKAISDNAHGYEYDRIYKTDLAALTVACYEILYTDTPPAVIANEAVETVKTYSGQQSYSFVNGILASVIKGKI